MKRGLNILVLMDCIFNGSNFTSPSWVISFLTMWPDTWDSSSWVCLQVDTKLIFFHKNTAITEMSIHFHHIHRKTRGRSLLGRSINTIYTCVWGNDLMLMVCKNGKTGGYVQCKQQFTSSYHCLILTTKDWCPSEDVSGEKSHFINNVPNQSDNKNW